MIENRYGLIKLSDSIRVFKSSLFLELKTCLLIARVKNIKILITNKSDTDGVTTLILITGFTMSSFFFYRG